MKKNRDIVSTASYDFLMYSGFATMAYFWALQAEAADKALRSGQGEQSEEFYRAKLATCEFYYERLLPRAKGHAKAALKPTRSTMQMKVESFSFDYE